MAQDARHWVNRWGKGADYLFYRESEFDENEIAMKQMNVCTCPNGNGKILEATIDLGIVQVFHTLISCGIDPQRLEYVDWESMKFGECRDSRVSDLTAFPLSDPGGFGLAQITAQQPAIANRFGTFFLAADGAVVIKEQRDLVFFECNGRFAAVRARCSLRRNQTECTV